MLYAKQVRIKLGFTQSEMAKACNCHVMTISRWERGILEPDGQAERLLELIDYIYERGMMPQYKKRFMAGV